MDDAPPDRSPPAPAALPLDRVVDDDTPRREAVEWAVEALHADATFDDVAAALAREGWPEEEAADIVESARQRTREHRGVLTRDHVVGSANLRYRQAMTGRWYVGMPMLAAAWRLMHSLSTLLALRRATPERRRPSPSPRATVKSSASPQEHGEG